MKLTIPTNHNLREISIQILIAVLEIWNPIKRRGKKRGRSQVPGVRFQESTDNTFTGYGSP